MTSRLVSPDFVELPILLQQPYTGWNEDRELERDLWEENLALSRIGWSETNNQKGAWRETEGLSIKCRKILNDAEGHFQFCGV